MSKSKPTRRSDWGRLTDAELIAQCDVDTYRASGPGGQKRNKTSSAVRLRHEPTGLIAIAEESRSQHENKAKAVKRLRTDDLPDAPRTGRSGGGLIRNRTLQPFAIPRIG